MKTKLIKVPTAERRPDKPGHYYTSTTKGKRISYFDRYSFDNYFSETMVWLEEIPDREDKMREMLDECRLQLEHLNKIQERGTTNSVLSRLNTLLNELKQTT